MKQSIKIVIFSIFILQFFTLMSICFNVRPVYIFLILLFLDGIGLAVLSVHFIRQYVNKNNYWIDLHGKGHGC